jgi:CTP:molybdopterin cytidylyltransferase MocA
MGRTKQLLPVNGRPAVRACAETVLAAGVDDIVVVVAPDGGAVEAALEGLPVRLVRNADPGSDMAGSVRTGLAAAPPVHPSILVCLADHPLVRPDTIRTILSGSAQHPGRIVIPRYQGRRGHPTLFPRPIIDEALSGKTLRDIIRDHGDGVHYLDVGDEGIVLDMDTEQDYRELLRRSGAAT